MKKNLLPFLAAFCLILSLSSCEAIAGIFKAGVWVGVLIVVAVIGLIVFALSRRSK
ncbi:MAG: phosphatidate cytidylyltransferase [Ferruginibacter sp.]